MLPLQPGATCLMYLWVHPERVCGMLCSLTLFGLGYFCPRPGVLSSGASCPARHLVPF
jgi:hypothetical protein